MRCLFVENYIKKYMQLINYEFQKHFALVMFKVKVLIPKLSISVRTYVKPRYKFSLVEICMIITVNFIVIHFNSQIVH